MKKTEVIVFNKENVNTGLSKKRYGYTYFTKKDFKLGEKLMMGFGRILDHQTSHMSVQIGPNKHYLPSKWTGRYWNHSCAPNAFVKTNKEGFPELFALKKINKGEEITYHYSMTELRWVKNAKENFVRCLCGEKTCKGKILSFTQLSLQDRKKLLNKKICSKYLTGILK